MAKPDNAKPGCYSGFLRVLLCAGNGNSPPVHPSDHVTESDKTKLVHPNKDANHAMADADAATPGVVARLMGLDSLPNTNWVSKGSTPDSVPRSRSVNFVDYLLEFDLSQANHRRVKTSASFREVPALFQQKNHDLVVLYWDSGTGSKDHEVESNLRKPEMGLGELRQRKKQGSKNKEIVRERSTVKKERNQGKNKKISKLKNEPRMVPVKHSSKVRNHNEATVLASVSPCSKNCSYRKSSAGSSSSSSSSSPLSNKQKNVFFEPKHTKKIRKQQSPKKIETEYSSENLSAVSVLDINDNDYPFLHGPDFLDYTSPLMSKSKWKSSELLFLGDGVEDKASKNKGYAYPDVNREKEYYSELMLKLRTLTEDDMRESDCTPKHMCETESFEEICLVYEHKIFDSLLHEVVNELVELRILSSCCV